MESKRKDLDELIEEAMRIREVTINASHDGRPRTDSVTQTDALLDALIKHHPERDPNKS